MQAQEVPRVMVSLVSPSGVPERKHAAAAWAGSAKVKRATSAPVHVQEQNNVCMCRNKTTN